MAEGPNYYQPQQAAPGYQVAQGYAMPQQRAPPAAAYGGVMIREDPKVVSALKMHKNGALLFVVAWIAIGLAIVLLALDLALLLSSISGSSVSVGGDTTTYLMYLTLSGMGLIGGGAAVRAVGFSMMMHADFVLRSRIPPKMAVNQ
jgi:hypothetical protein